MVFLWYNAIYMYLHPDAVSFIILEVVPLILLSVVI